LGTDNATQVELPA